MGKRWPLQDRVRFARQAARMGVEVVAARAQVEPATVQGWMGEFAHKSAAAFNREIDPSQVPAITAATLTIQPVDDPIYQQAVMDAAHKLALSAWGMYQQHKGDGLYDDCPDAENAEIDNLWDAIIATGDPQDNEALMNALLAERIEHWAYERMEDSDWDAPDRPVGADEDHWVQSIWRQAIVKASELRWAELLERLPEPTS